MANNWIGRHNKINGTGFYRVTKQKSKGTKKGYRYFYRMQKDLIKIVIANVDLLKLKEKVLQNGLYWVIEDKEKALQTCINENVNPMVLNSSIDPKYTKYNFSFEDYIKFKEIKEGGKSE